MVKTISEVMNDLNSSLKSAETYLDVELEDDDTPYGGTSFMGETLWDFLIEIGAPLNSPMDKVNNMLKECGIMPIKF